MRTYLFVAALLAMNSILTSLLEHCSGNNKSKAVSILPKMLAATGLVEMK